MQDGGPGRRTRETPADENGGLDERESRTSVVERFRVRDQTRERGKESEKSQKKKKEKKKKKKKKKKLDMRNPPSSSSGTRTKTSTTTPCCSKVGIKKGPWTPEEDELLSNYINREGEGRWRTLPKRAGLLRCGKSCRLRWMNYLRPCVKRGRIAPDEEDLILRLHRLLGNRWSLIAGRIPGRTDNEIKNYWNTHLSKKLIGQGIDPRTHKPLINPPPPLPTHTSSGLYEHEHNLLSNSNPNPNPNPASLEQEKGYQVITAANGIGNLTNNLQNDVQVVDNGGGGGGGFMMGLLPSNGEGGHSCNQVVEESRYYYIGNCIEDNTFSSILDSFINDNYMFANNNHHHHHHHQQQQQPQPQPPQLQTLPPVVPLQVPEPGMVVGTSGGQTFGGIWEGDEMVSTMAAANLGGDHHQQQQSALDNQRA
ncbi:hypothetical protein Q3G72_010234 [Acer saccharum]|nr:hypothetical protein Q3G72_010234 [Acer saccharum]